MTVAVTLVHPENPEFATVLLTRNRHGQLPTVLHDPLDSDGDVVTGLWLGNGYEGTVYEWTEQAGPLRQSQRRGKDGPHAV